jgi:hypothetical protein
VLWIGADKHLPLPRVQAESIRYPPHQLPIRMAEPPLLQVTDKAQAHPGRGSELPLR